MTNRLPLREGAPLSTPLVGVPGAPLALRFALVAADGQPLDLTGRTAVFEVTRDAGELHMTRQMVATDPAAGLVSLTLTGLETTQAGTYTARVLVMNGGAVERALPGSKAGLLLTLAGRDAPERSLFQQAVAAITETRFYRAGARLAESLANAAAARAAASEAVSAAVAGALGVDPGDTPYASAIVAASTYGALGSRPGAPGAFAELSSHSAGPGPSAAVRRGGGLFVWRDLATTGLDERPDEDGGTVRHIASQAGAWWERADDGPLCPEWFGAAGDGVTDDTAALDACHQAAVALGRSVHYSRVYGINPSATLNGIGLRVGLVIPSGLKTGGGGALRVLDGAGDYEALLDVSDTRGVTLNGIVLDQNTTGNPVDYPDLMTPTNFRCVVWGRDADELRIQNCIFRDLDNINTVFGAYSDAGGTHPGFVEPVVSGNRFELAERPGTGATYTHDHSTVYFTGVKAQVVANTFTGMPGVTPGNGRTKDYTINAIEAHAESTILYNTIERAYSLGMWLVSAEPLSWADNLHVQHNNISDVFAGIRVLALDPGAVGLPARPDRSGELGVDYAMLSAGITRNNIVLNPDAWYVAGMQVTGEAVCAGIALYQGSNGPVRGLNIEHNTVRFKAVADALAPHSFGGQDFYISFIGLHVDSTQAFKTGAAYHDDVSVRWNRVYATPGQGVNVSGRYRRLHVEDNRTVGGGYGYAGRPLIVGGVVVTGVVIDGQVHRNVTTDQDGDMQFGVYIYAHEGSTYLHAYDNALLDAAGLMKFNPLYVEPGGFDLDPSEPVLARQQTRFQLALVGPYDPGSAINDTASGVRAVQIVGAGSVWVPQPHGRALTAVPYASGWDDNAAQIAHNALIDALRGPLILPTP